MAAFDIVTWDSTNNRNKRKTSSAFQFDFQSIRIGADALAIVQSGSGGSAVFDFGAKKLTNLADPTSSNHAATKNYVDVADTALQNAINAITTGLQWRPGAIAATGDAGLNAAADDTALSTLLPFSDDDSPQMVIGDFADGEYLLSKNGASSKLFLIYDDSGTLKVTTVGVTALASGDVFLVKNDLPDTPASQEGAAIYSYTGTDLIKVGDVDWSLATGIDLSGGFTPTPGTVMAGDSVELAIAKLADALGGGGFGDFFADGSVPMTGNLDVGGFSVLNVSDISDGSNQMALDVDGRALTDSTAAAVAYWDSTGIAMASGKTVSNLAAPTNNQDAATKLYVDNAVTALNLSDYINRDGSVAFTGNADLGGNRIVNLADPQTDSEAATKAYVDAVATGLDIKASVRAATTAALPSVTYNNGASGVGASLTATANGALPAQDGVTLSVGESLLVKNQAAGLQNGIYVVAQVGDGSNPFVLERRADADTGGITNPEVTTGMHTFVEEGTVQAGYGYVLTTQGTITMGTTALTFSQFSQAAAYSAGAGIDISSNTISLKYDNKTLNFDGGGLLQVHPKTSGGLAIDANGVFIAAQGVTAAMLGAVAGDGLTGGSGSALAAQAADTSINVASGGISVNFSETRTNDNAGSITARQIVYIKSNGNVDLASATAQDDKVKLGVVQSASIATTASGLIYETAGVRIGGFTGLTVGAPVYLDTTAGATTQSLAGFTTGNFIWKLGVALSSSTLEFAPEFLLEY